MTFGKYNFDKFLIVVILTSIIDSICRRVRVWLAVACGLSLTTHSGNAQVSIRNYRVPDGLPQTQVYCVAGDLQGNIWLGTLGGGIASFNGRTFTTINVSSGLPSDIVLDIAPDRNGVWIATQKGIAYYRGSQLKNYPFELTDGNYPKEIFVSQDTLFIRNVDNSINIIAGDSLITEADLSRWEGIRSVMKPYTGITTVHRTVGNINELTIIRNDVHDIIHLPPQVKNVFSLFPYRNDSMVSTNDGLYLISGDSLRFFRAHRFPVFQYSERGDFFVGKEDNMLVVYGPGGRKIISDFKALVKVIRSDDDGTTWLGTDKGLYRITFTAFTRVNSHQTPEPIMSVHAVNNQLWVGTASQGVEVYQDTVRLRQFDLGSVRKNYITSVKSDRHGVMYFGTGGGVARCYNGKVTWLSPGLIESSASLAIGHDDRIVIASSVVGAYWAKGDSAGAISGLEKDVIQSIDYKESLDAYVFGTNNGLKRMDGLRVTSPDIPALDNIQLSSVRWVSDDVIAIGSYGHGFFLYSFSKNRILLSVNEQTGLSSNTIFMVHPDGGNFWIGTIRGIDLIELNQERNTVRSITHFNESDGLAGLETNQDAVTVKDSTVYFGLVSGLYKFNGTGKQNPHRLRLTQVALFFDKPVELDTTGVQQFNSDDNHVTFTFSKVDKRDPGEVYYRYKLDGFDQVWSGVTKNNSVTYGNLPHGDFVFNVTTTDKSGTFTFDTVQYRFRVSAPYYRTWWFSALAVALLAGLLIPGIVLYNKWKFAKAIQLQRLKEQERDKLRKDIARDFHDELGNQVARIINYVSLMRISNTVKENVYETLSQFSQGIFQGTRDFVWALDPANDDLESVMIHLKDFGEQMFQEKNIGFSFHGEAPLSFRLPMGFSRQINLIMKEAMTNAFRHSEATAVDLVVAISSRRVIITLKDNGKGIGSTDRLNSHRGLENMSIRAKRINAVLRVANGNPGTIVELEMGSELLAG